MLVLYKKPCATNHALYLMISLFSLRFRTNTHLYLTSFTSPGFWTIGPKTSCFVDEFNSTYITSFHFGQSFPCRYFLIFHGLKSSLFLMISKATWKSENIVNSNIILIPFFYCVYITY